MMWVDLEIGGIEVSGNLKLLGNPAFKFLTVSVELLQTPGVLKFILSLSSGLLKLLPGLCNLGSASADICGRSLDGCRGITCLWGGQGSTRAAEQTGVVSLFIQTATHVRQKNAGNNQPQELLFCLSL